MLQSVFIPRVHAEPLAGWLISEPVRPDHEVRYFRALLDERPSDAEWTAIVRQAETLERERRVHLEVLVRRTAR